MSYQFNGTESLYRDMKMPVDTPEDEERKKEMDKMKNEAMDSMLWAASQNIAMNKVKLYHTLAKEIYSQQ